MSTFHRVLQLGASRRRREDAIALLTENRWNGATYIGGYAVECALKSLVCYLERVNDFQDTSLFKGGFTGASLHNLALYLDKVAPLKRAIALDTTHRFREAWNSITSTWEMGVLRYSDKLGDEAQGRQFMVSVALIHDWILRQQGEAS